MQTPQTDAVSTSSTLGEGLLTKAEIVSAQDIKYEDVPVPEWGGKVRVAVITGPMRDAFEISCLEGKGKLQKFTMKNIRAKLASFAIVDANGNRMFSDAEIAILEKKSGLALDRIWTVASRLNGITKEDVEELAGNSSDGQSDVLSLDSPSRNSAVPLVSS